MPYDPRPWPTHGNAVTDRDTVGDNLVAILREIRELRRLSERSAATRLDIAITVGRIEQYAGDSLLRLARQGYPWKE